MESDQFEILLHEIKELRVEMRAHVDEKTAETRSYTGEMVAGLRAHTAAMGAQLRAHTDATTNQLRDEIRSASAETRRHFDVVADSLRADIRLVAEGVATVDAKHERFRGEVAHEFAETRSMIRLSYSELDRRLRAVETARDR